MTDPLQPSPALLAKIGSALVHADEATGPNGHLFDLGALRALLEDEDVRAWLSAMEVLALVPAKRNPMI